MTFQVTFRKENGEYAYIDLAAPSKFDAYIIFMAKYPKSWEIASVKRAMTRKKKVAPTQGAKKTLVSFTISPTEVICYD